VILDDSRVLVGVLRDPVASEAQLRSAAGRLVASVSGSGAADVDAALTELAGAFSLPDLTRSSYAAGVAGTLLEGGANPTPIAAPLVQHLAHVLELAARLAAECARRTPEPDENTDAWDQSERVRLEISATMPLEAEAWEALKASANAGTTLFALSRSARASGQRLYGLASQIDQHEGALWLRKILAVLDDAPFMAIEPARNEGIVGTISGVAENFQLQMLLMDLFPRRLFSGRRLSKAAAAVAHGSGPQRIEEGITGAWNLYDWTAVGRDRALPDPGDMTATGSWIWGEGTPADIPVFEGHRVILLGPASYPRAFPVQRMFGVLQARMKTERRLSRTEIAGWLARMAEAPKAELWRQRARASSATTS
jgi:hypothetical protein